MRRQGLTCFGSEEDDLSFALVQPSRGRLFPLARLDQLPSKLLPLRFERNLLPPQLFQLTDERLPRPLERSEIGDQCLVGHPRLVQLRTKRKHLRLQLDPPLLSPQVLARQVVVLDPQLTEFGTGLLGEREGFGQLGPLEFLLGLLGVPFVPGDKAAVLLARGLKGGSGGGRERG